MSPDQAASVKARLLARAKAQGEEFERTLARFAAERLLYRLGVSPLRERCTLKGASLLAVWLTNPHRATRDVDLLATGAATESGVRTMVEGICAVPCPEDALRFDLSDLVLLTIRAEEGYPGMRACTAWLVTQDPEAARVSPARRRRLRAPTGLRTKGQDFQAEARVRASLGRSSSTK